MEDHADAGAGGPLLWSRAGGLRGSLERRLPELPQHLRDYVAGVIQYQAYRCAALVPAPVFSYLVREPSFQEAHVKNFQPGTDRDETYWRLP